MKDLTDTDIANILAIIDVASQRGCFKATDMTTVGQLYEKLQKLISSEEPKNNSKEKSEAKERGVKQDGKL
jgi:hypothetical protein